MKKPTHKRKSKEIQLRRVISKQAEEIKHLRAMLEYKVNEEYNAMQQAAFEWAAKNMHIETHAPEYRIRAYKGESIMENIAEPPRLVFKNR